MNVGGIQPGEWTIISALLAAIVSLVIYIWHALDKRVNKLDDPTTGHLASVETALRERLHKLSGIMMQHSEKIAVHEESRESVREDLRELKDGISDLRDMVQRVLLRIGIPTPSGGARRIDR